MHVKRTRIVENTWVCSSCKKKNLGRDTKCVGCGSPKEKDEKDIVPSPESAPTVTDPELLRLAQQGPNWVCEFCGGQTRDEFGKCRNCAGPKAEIKSTDLGMWKEPGWDQVKATAERIKAEKQPPKKSWQPIYTAGSVAAGAALFIWLCIWLFTPHEEKVSVDSTTWKYTSTLKQKTQKHGSSWNSPSESSAFNVSCSSKYYGDRDCNPYQCNPHQETYSCNCTSYECNCHESCSDNKNGFSTCTTRCSTCSKCSTCSRTVYSTCYQQCPVYKDWCEYEYFAWPVIDQRETAGVDHSVSWPALEAVGVNQRLERTENYQIVFKKKDKSWKYVPKNLDEFKKFRSKTNWKIKVRRVGLLTEPLEEVK